MMKKVLVVFSHPKFEHSEVNKALIGAISGLEMVEIRDLYELYPDFNISIQAEQEALFEAGIIVWHHPIVTTQVLILINRRSAFLNPKCLLVL